MYNFLNLIFEYTKDVNIQEDKSSGLIACPGQCTSTGAILFFIFLFISA